RLTGDHVDVGPRERAEQMGEPALVRKDVAVDEEEQVATGLASAEVLERIFLEAFLHVDLEVETRRSAPPDLLLGVLAQGLAGDGHELGARSEAVEEASGLGRQRLGVAPLRDGLPLAPEGGEEGKRPGDCVATRRAA